MRPENFNIGRFAKILKTGSGLNKGIWGLAKKTAVIRWAVAICLSAILSFLLTPHVHLSYPDYKVGSIAAVDVRADRDFLVEDTLSTEQKKNEALKNIQSVFDYDSEIAFQLKTAVTKAFAAAEQAHDSIVNMPFSKSMLPRLKKDFDNSLGIIVSDDEFLVLQKYKFSRHISDNISKIIAVVYNNTLITNAVFTKLDTENGILIRDIKTQKEKIETNLKRVTHIDRIDKAILNKASGILDNSGEDLIRVVLAVSQKLIQPNLTFNKNASERKKQALQNEVKPVFFQVLKDEIIVREGQRISPADQNKLEVLFAGKGEKYSSNISIISGTFLLILSLSIVLFYLTVRYLKSNEDINDILFLGVTAVFQIFLVKLGIFMSEAINRAFPLISMEACFYAVPFAAGAILVGVIINRNAALIFSIYTSFLAAFLFDGKMSIMLFSFLGAVAASYQATYCKQRSAFFKIGLLLGFVNCATILFLCLSSPSCNILSSITIIMLAMGLTGGLVSGIIVAGVAPLFESLFNYTTDIKLLELANLNQPIFQKMIMEAPGTYHHSIIVATLVEAAAEAIGANPLLAKVSAYYHDIGKINKPLYFIENQRNGENKHDKLSPRMSSLIITAHVKGGCELAKKAKLGTKITNIIREHHGTSLVSYFYEKAKRDRDPSIRALPENDFRYAGPKPQSREAGLVLLGDVIEASSRTLTNPTPSRIKNLVRERIEKVFTDGQLDECELTLHDLNKIAENFTRILYGIFHQRIDYPDPVIREFHSGRKENNVHINRRQAEKSKS